MIQLCESLGVSEGILFVQGIHDPESGQFKIFEAGLRCAGEAPYRFLKKITNQSLIHILVDHALLGKSDYDIHKELPKLNGKCCGVVSFVAKHGIVKRIDGLEETIASIPSVISYENRYPVGRETPDTDTLRQLMLRFIIVCENREQMAADIQRLNEGITVWDDQGHNMVVKFLPERLFDLQ